MVAMAIMGRLPQQCFAPDLAAADFSRKAVARHGQKAEGDIFWSTAERIYRPA